MTNITPFILGFYEVLWFWVFTFDCYYVIIIYIEIKDLKIVGERGEVLSGFIPKLKSFQSKRGAEGVAYFAGKEYIVKYFERIGLKYSLFDNYCKEIKSFGDEGLAYPKVYSWATSPICADHKVFRFYILEEQIPGKELYPHSLYKIEDDCRVFCSKRDFDRAIEDADKHKELYAKILDTFFRIYIEQNKELADISNDEVLNFVKSYFVLNRRAQFTVPDMHPGNVIFDGSKLTMIDGTMCEQRKEWIGYDGQFKEHKYKLDSFFDIMALLSSNKYIDYYLENFQRHTGDLPSRELVKVGEENKKYMTQVAKKFVKAAKEVVGEFPLNETEVCYLYGQVNSALTKRGQREILKELER